MSLEAVNLTSLNSFHVGQEATELKFFVDFEPLSLENLKMDAA